MTALSLGPFDSWGPNEFLAGEVLAGVIFLLLGAPACVPWQVQKQHRRQTLAGRFHFRRFRSEPYPGAPPRARVSALLAGEVPGVPLDLSFQRARLAGGARSSAMSVQWNKPRKTAATAWYEKLDTFPTDDEISGFIERHQNVTKGDNFYAFPVEKVRVFLVNKWHVEAKRTYKAWEPRLLAEIGEDIFAKGRRGGLVLKSASAKKDPLPIRLQKRVAGLIKGPLQQTRAGVVEGYSKMLAIWRKAKACCSLLTSQRLFACPRTLRSRIP